MLDLKVDLFIHQRIKQVIDVGAYEQNLYMIFLYEHEGMDYLIEIEFERKYFYEPIHIKVFSPSENKTEYIAYKGMGEKFRKQLIKEIKKYDHELYDIIDWEFSAKRQELFKRYKEHILWLEVVDEPKPKKKWYGVRHQKPKGSWSGKDPLNVLKF